jgi:TonB-dependent SusC/RagA subfamily outer membrane receptor
MKIRVLIIVLTCFVLSGSVYSQRDNKRRVITGVVTDLDKKPVAGAIIMVDNKNSNEITDKKGFYKIKVKPAAVTISVLISGNGAYESAIEGRQVINFEVRKSPDLTTTKSKPDAESEEVNIGYGTRKRDDMSFSVSSVNLKNEAGRTYSNIYQMISGKVPGVTVVGQKISITGASSLMASTDPLLVVNGIVVNTIDYINPYDVKSIDILKGAAASIYGSRGANGVILITLK